MQDNITDTMSPEQVAYYNQSVIDFEAILKPFLLENIHNCFDVELTTDIKLDREHGIDCRIYALTNNKVEALYVGFKMQKVSSDWGTICVRYSRGSGRKTEYDKMLDLISKDEVRPQLHMHCYCDYNGKVLALYVVKTDELIEYISHHIDLVDRRYKNGDSFLAVKISELSACGISVAKVTPQRGRLRIV